VKKLRPKTGERRRTRQPLKLDRVPELLRDRVMQERAAGRTWMEIEELSPRFEEWEKTPAEIQAQFPGRKLPHTTLQRWYDLRVDQVKREMLADAERARSIAASFAEAKFEELPEAVQGALRDQIFSLMQAADLGSKSKAIGELQKLARLLVQQKRLDIMSERTKAETKRVELLEREFEIRKKKLDEETDKAARKAARGKAITTDDINRIRERTFGLPPIAGSPAA
jgi:hypothetical protein